MVRGVLVDGPGLSLGEGGHEATDPLAAELALEHLMEPQEGAAVARRGLVGDLRDARAVRVGLFGERDAVLGVRLHLHEVPQPDASDLGLGARQPEEEVGDDAREMEQAAEGEADIAQGRAPLGGELGVIAGL